MTQVDLNLFGFCLDLILRWVCCMVLLAQTHDDLQLIRVTSCSLFLFLPPLGIWEVSHKDSSLISRDFGKANPLFPSSLKDAEGTIIVGTCVAGRKHKGDGKSHSGLTSPCFLYPVPCFFSTCTLFSWHTKWCLTSQMHHMLLAVLRMSSSSPFQCGMNPIDSFTPTMC